MLQESSESNHLNAQSPRGDPRVLSILVLNKRTMAFMIAGRSPKLFCGWIIEVSNNGVHWTEIDRRENNSDLNAPHVTRNFKISKVPSECFRLFRL